MAPDETTDQATGLLHSSSYAAAATHTHVYKPTFTPIMPSFTRLQRLRQLLGNASAASITRQTGRGLFWPHRQHLLNCPLKWPHLALFALFCMSHSALGRRVKHFQSGHLGSINCIGTRLRHKRPDIKVTEKCDSVVEDLFYFGAKIGDNLDEDLGDKMIVGWATITGCHLLYQWLWDKLFHFIKNTIADV